MAMLTGMQAQGVYSPRVNGLKAGYDERMSEVTRSEAADERGYFVVTCSEEASAADIANGMKTYGAEIRALMGNQLLVEVPMSQLDNIAAIGGVLLIDVPPTETLKTDLVRQVSHVNEAHQKATGLPQAYTGKGVIIGLIDIGYDYTHPMFKDKDGNLRIKGVYQPGAENLRAQGEPLSDITVTDDKGKTTTVTLTGQFITNPDILLDTTLMKDTASTHGTHCASIAAGSIMNGENGVKGLSGAEYGYVGGMAPEAELLLSNKTVTEEQKTKYKSLTTDFYNYNSMQALYAMKHYAAQQNKPLVISWSQNNHNGFHDDTSTGARYIANYCKGGNIMALCASNEARGPMYIERPITKGRTLEIRALSMLDNCEVETFIKTKSDIRVDLEVVDSKFNTVYRCNLPLTTAGNYSYQRAFMTGVMYENNEKFWMYSDEYYRTHGPQNNLLPYISKGTLEVATYKGTGLDADNQPFDYTNIVLEGRGFDTEKDVYGGWYTFVLMLTPVEEDVVSQSWGDGFYLAATKMEDDSRFYSGDTEHSMGDMNTSGEPVTIGAYAANILRPDDKGQLEPMNGEEVGRYASFSSYGYDFSAQKRTYPDVSAPGVAVLAAENSFCSEAPAYASRKYSGQFKGQSEPRSYNYVFLSGTSMSTPAAAGIIALWVQAAQDKGRKLTNRDIKDIIRITSDKDEYTQAEPLRYGAGKINAYKGLIYILGLAGIRELSQDQPEGVSFRLAGGQLIAEGATEGTPVTLYDLNGRCVGRTCVSGGAIPLDGLTAGVYAVQLGRQGSTLIRL